MAILGITLILFALVPARSVVKLNQTWTTVFEEFLALTESEDEIYAAEMLAIKKQLSDRENVIYAKEMPAIKEELKTRGEEIRVIERLAINTSMNCEVEPDACAQKHQQLDKMDLSNYQPLKVLQEDIDKFNALFNKKQQLQTMNLSDYTPIRVSQKEIDDCVAFKEEMNNRKLQLEKMELSDYVPVGVSQKEIDYVFFKQQQFEDVSSRLETEKGYLCFSIVSVIVALGLGLILATLGLFLWYIRHQRLMDYILSLRANTLKEKKTRSI